MAMTGANWSVFSFILVGSYYSYWNLVIIGVVISSHGRNGDTNMSQDEAPSKNYRWKVVSKILIPFLNILMSISIEFLRKMLRKNLLAIICPRREWSKNFQKLEQTARQEPNTRVNQIKNSIPHYVQWRCHACWNLSPGEREQWRVIVINGANEILGILDRPTLMRVMNREQILTADHYQLMILPQYFYLWKLRIFLCCGCNVCLEFMQMQDPSRNSDFLIPCESSYWINPTHCDSLVKSFTRQ